MINYGYNSCKVDFMSSFLNRIRALREDNDLTQTQIANILGTSQTMYARYERGANELPIRHLTVLCSFYNVSADSLLGLSVDKNREQGAPDKLKLNKISHKNK